MSEMKMEELHEQIYDRFFKEQAAFKDSLLAMKPEEVLDHAREYCIREDFLCIVEEAELSEKQLDAMLRNNVTLTDLYQAYSDGDSTHHMEKLRDLIESRANGILREEFKLYAAPVYRQPYSYAQEHGEVEQYRLSRKANIACREAIEQAVNENYRDNRLSRDAAKQVVERFGFERTMFVLTVTIRHKDWDERFSKCNRQWAQEQQVFEDRDSARNVYDSFVVDRCHSCLTDLFTSNVRQDYLRSLPLTDKDIRDEAQRIMDGFRSCPQPNSPNGTHYMVRVSEDFLFRVRGQQTSKLSQHFPFRSFTLSRLEGQKGLYALIRKDEDRSKPLRETKTSVRKKLQDSPKINTPNNSAHFREPEL